MSYLANFGVVNNFSQVCSDVKKFRFFLPDAHNNVYITDNHVVCRCAMKDTAKLRIWRYLHQYECTRQIIDGENTIKPAWNAVLLVDEIMDKKKQIYVDDTLILHCQIESYEK
uniref:ZP domain-containing protein n=1 Tax=Panagrellus redivivus TaxID=6233 RepID=A0A7E4WDQ0_PANRE